MYAQQHRGDRRPEPAVADAEQELDADHAPHFGMPADERHDRGEEVWIGEGGVGLRPGQPGDERRRERGEHERRERVRPAPVQVVRDEAAR